MEHDKRPWGEYFVMEDAATHKVKRIEVYPGGRLSYQYHAHRSEVWTIVSGTARVILNEEAFNLVSGEYIYIPQGARHRIENPSDTTLVFIEVQVGTYFGEDDIVRLEDDYNRK